MARRILTVTLLLALLGRADAGGGPETTLLVVNRNSPVSRRIANAYTRRRGIPASHRLYLDGIPHIRIISLDEFKKRILGPIRAFLKERGLSDQIDLIAYSADFPYGVDFKTMEGVGGKHAVASLTGITYLAGRLERGPRALAATNANLYFRTMVTPGAGKKTRNANAEERTAFTEARQALQEKDYRNAAKAYARFLGSYEFHADSWFNYARCLSHLGRKEEAFDALGKAIEHGFAQTAAMQRAPELGVLRKDPRFKNLVEKTGSLSGTVRAAHGFRATYLWNRGADPVTAGGERYRMAVMLAYTGEWGNSTPEALSYLESAASSDGTHPDGTVYFLVNKDIRSKTREPYFPAATAALKKRNRKVETLRQGQDGQSGTVPNGKPDVIGAALGKAAYAWNKSKSTILPGAICENLTSFGAVFNNGSQTKLTELLRYGAAGSSGAVVEPYALWWKFPLPFIHAHYVDGCSLAEAFYQSVSGPYQLLIVGDPLARPFAKFVDLKVRALRGPWKKRVEVEAAAPGAAEIEVWIDGRRVARGKPGEKLFVDTTRFADGLHDVRYVAIEVGRIETRSHQVTRQEIDNGGRTILAAKQKAGVVFGGTVNIAGKAAGAQSVEAWLGSWKVAEAATEAGSFELKFAAADLGLGTVSLVLRAMGADGSAVLPYEVVVVPAVLGEPLMKMGPVLSGLRGVVTDREGRQRPVAQTTLGNSGGRSVTHFLSGQKVKRLVLEGEFEVPCDGAHELLLHARGGLKVSIGGRTLFEGRDVSDQLFFPLFLKAGWYPIRFELEPRGRPQLVALLGGERVTRPLRLHCDAGAALGAKPQSDNPALTDGKRSGTVVEVSSDGVELTWKKTARGVARIVLFPEPSQLGGPAFPKEWAVDVRGRAGKWAPVDVTVVRAKSARRPPFDRKKEIKPVEVPDYVALLFEPLDARRLRIRPAGKPARLLEIEVYGPLP